MKDHGIAFGVLRGVLAFAFIVQWAIALNMRHRDPILAVFWLVNSAMALGLLLFFMQAELAGPATATGGIPAPKDTEHRTPQGTQGTEPATSFSETPR